MKYAVIVSALSAWGVLAGALLAADPSSPSTSPVASTAPGVPPPTVEFQQILLAPNTLSDSFGQCGLRLVIKNAGGKIMGPPNPVTVTRFEDNEGNPLFNTYELTQKFPKGRLVESPDRETAALTLTGKNRPSDTATSIILEGTLHLTLGNNSKTFSAKNVKLQYGFEFQAGEQKFVVESLSDFGLALNQRPGDMLIGFQTKPIAIGDARLFTSDGKILGHAHPRTLEAPDPKNPDRPWGFAFEVNHSGKTVDFEIDICQDVSTVDCPIKIEASLAGLPLGRRSAPPRVPVPSRVPPPIPAAGVDLP